MSIVSTSLNVWREEIGRRMLNLDFKPYSDDPFRAELVPVLDSDGIRVVRSAHTSGLTFRDKRLLKDGSDTVALIINTSAKIEVEHQGRETTLSRGEAIFLENFEAGKAGSASNFEITSIVLPRDVIKLSNADRHETIATQINKHSCSLRLLKAYIAALGSQIGGAPELQKVACGHVRDLVRLTIAERAGQAPDGQCASVAEARIRVALEFIARNFRRPDLTVAHVAVHQNLSPRYLQKLFEIRNIRYVDHVSEVRLMEALRLLTDRNMRERPVTDIALASGFSDISHFNRTFRRRFGVTPTAIRTGAH